MKPVRRVLAVEDNPGDVRLIKEALEDDGSVVVEVATDAVDALDLLDEGPRIDLVLLDVNLPGADGFDILDQIRRGRHRDVPVVMFTSSNLIEDVRRGEREGANMFVVKPFDVIEYLITLRALRDEVLGAAT